MLCEAVDDPRTKAVGASLAIRVFAAKRRVHACGVASRWTRGLGTLSDRNPVHITLGALWKPPDQRLLSAATGVHFKSSPEVPPVPAAVPPVPAVGATSARGGATSARGGATSARGGDQPVPPVPAFCSAPFEPLVEPPHAAGPPIAANRVVISQPKLLRLLMDPVLTQQETGRLANLGIQPMGAGLPVRWVKLCQRPGWLRSSSGVCRAQSDRPTGPSNPRCTFARRAQGRRCGSGRSLDRSCSCLRASGASRIGGRRAPQPPA